MKSYRKLWFLPFLLFAVLLLALTVSATGTGAGTQAGTDKLNVKPDTVSSNVFVFGKSMSGMTYDAAAEYISNHVNGLLSARVSAVNPETYETWSRSLAELGVTYDDQTVRDAVRGTVITGNLLERYKKAKDYENEPLVLTLSSHYNADYIMETITDVVKTWNHDPVESTASCITGELVIDVGQNGYEFRIEDSVRDLLALLKQNEITKTGFVLHPEYTMVEAILSPERVANFSVLGSCTTRYTKPTDEILANRQQNLVQSTRNMNGHVFAPGDVISALELYGPVTTEHGYRKAGTYTTNGHTDEIGGGICQTTSTMYNAVLMAELEVVYRRNHSYMVTYLSPSKDAMVYYQGGYDFKFRNSSSDYIIIDAYVNTEENTLTVNIIGHEDQPSTHSVRYESEVLSMEIPSLYKVYTMDLVIGLSDSPKFTVADDYTALPACKSRLWKITTDDGVETRTLVSTDTYKPMGASIRLAYDVDAEYWIDDDYDLQLEVHFIDENETSIAADLTLWTAEQRAKFNADMKEKMAAIELEWPGKGNSYTRYVQRNGSWKYVEIIGNTLPPEEESSTDAGESGSEGGESSGGTDAPSGGGESGSGATDPAP